MTRPSLAVCVAFVALAALAAPALAARSAKHFFNPQYCPNTIVRQQINPRLASDCSAVVLPWRLCTSCRLREYNATGFFKNNRDIYDFSQPACLKGLEFYAAQNPCDVPRVEQVAIYSKALKDGTADKWPAKRAQKDLAEFMYNICELCCDCVPIGSEIDEYEQRSKVKSWLGNKKSLIFVQRGNCPVHYFYDTCRMWPNLTDVVAPGQKPQEGLDQICRDHVYPWWFNDNPNYRVNWLRREEVEIPSWRFKAILAKMTNLLGCSQKTVWQECVGMELAQGRV